MPYNQAHCPGIVWKKIFLCDKIWLKSWNLFQIENKNRKHHETAINNTLAGTQGCIEFFSGKNNKNKNIVFRFKISSGEK